MKTIICCSNNDSSIEKKWDDFVDNHPDGKFYHLFRWKTLIEETFRLKSFYFYTMENDVISGILPTFLSKSLIFGRYITSIPFFNYGGILAKDDLSKKMLIEEASKIAIENKVPYIELRHIQKSSLSLPTKTHKIRMTLDLPQTPELLWTSFKSKLRSQIKRAQKEDMTAKIGKEDLIDDFYKVFAENMRSLGTPVWTKNIFSNTLKMFPENANVSVVYYNKKPIAGAFLHNYKDTVEIPSASSLRKYNKLSPNMLLYWTVLKYACENGFKKFDFGRSSPDSGPHRFKKQWNAKPETLHWEYWLAEGEKMPQLNPQNPKYKLMINTWKKIPLFITNNLGPIISRNLS